MNESPITAEDLTLYALDLLDRSTTDRVALLLRSSSQAQQELSLVRRDLGMLALSAPDHAPSPITRQRFLQQVAREPRGGSASTMNGLATGIVDQGMVDGRVSPALLTQEERRARVRLPRVIAEPEPMFSSQPAEPTQSQGAAIGSVPPLASPSAEVVSSLPGAAAVAQSTGTPRSETAPSPETDSPSVAAGPVLVGRKSSVPDDTGTRSALWQMPPASDMAPDADAGDRSTPTPITRRSRGAVVMAWTGWAAAAGLAAATVFSVQNTSALREQLRTQQAKLADTEARTARADVVLETLESKSAQRFVLARQDTAPIPSARVAYLPEQGSLVFQGTNLEPLPSDKTYELWLIPKGEGTHPLPAGTFRPDARGYATLVMPSLPHGTVASTFGVTVEEEAGSATPTLPILLIGQQG